MFSDRLLIRFAVQLPVLLIICVKYQFQLWFIDVAYGRIKHSIWRQWVRWIFRHSLMPVTWLTPISQIFAEFQLRLDEYMCASWVFPVMASRANRYSINLKSLIPDVHSYKVMFYYASNKYKAPFPLNNICQPTSNHFWEMLNIDLANLDVLATLRHTDRHPTPTIPYAYRHAR